MLGVYAGKVRAARPRRAGDADEGAVEGAGEGAVEGAGDAAGVGAGAAAGWSEVAAGAGFAGAAIAGMAGVPSEEPVPVAGAPSVAAGLAAGVLGALVRKTEKPTNTTSAVRATGRRILPIVAPEAMSR